MTNLVARSDKGYENYLATLPFPSDLWSIFSVFQLFVLGFMAHSFTVMVQSQSSHQGYFQLQQAAPKKAPTTHRVLCGQHQTTVKVSDYLVSIVDLLTP